MYSLITGSKYQCKHNTFIWSTVKHDYSVDRLQHDLYNAVYSISIGFQTDHMQLGQKIYSTNLAITVKVKDLRVCET